MGLTDIELARSFNKIVRRPFTGLDDINQYADGGILSKPKGIVYYRKKLNNMKRKHMFQYWLYRDVDEFAFEQLVGWGLWITRRIFLQIFHMRNQILWYVEIRKSLLGVMKIMHAPWRLKSFFAKGEIVEHSLLWRVSNFEGIFQGYVYWRPKYLRLIFYEVLI